MGTTIITKAKGLEISRRIVLGGFDRNGRNHDKAMFMATKMTNNDLNGHYVIMPKKLFGVISDVYNTSDEVFIKEVINYLVTQNYLGYRKFDNGGMVFWPTKKMFSVVLLH